MIQRRSLIRSSAPLGFWLTLTGAAFVALAQSQSQNQPTQPPPVAATSPAIITLPQGAGKTNLKPPAQQPVPDTAKGKPSATQDAQNQAKNELDPTGVPPKDPKAVGSAYIIGPEDYLYIRVWKSPEFSGTVSVGPDGTISMQLINEVKASGMTARQLADVLADRLKEFLTTPEVNVQVLAARSRTYIILGDGVVKPGIYPLPKPLTVLEALIAGGSFSPFAKKNKIYVLRGSQKLSFNWNEVSKGKNLAQNILIQNGDKIYVP